MKAPLGQHAGATATRLLSIREDQVLDRTDWLAVEEPLEIRVQGPGQDALSVTVNMWTPGNDAELAVGFLYTEGLIRSRAEIVEIEAHTQLNGQPM
jgi:FdhD protein